MTDRELLELAARAAGYIYVEDSFCQREGLMMINFSMWNPLTDDGDAMRLEIDAQINIEFAFCEDDAPIVIAGDRCNQVQECLAPDFKANTRRAIVRAAAEIGKGM